MKRFLLLPLLTIFSAMSVWAQHRAQPLPLLNGGQLAQERMYYSLDEAMANPSQVRKLSLAKERLKEFPIEVLMFKNIQVLNLSGNKIDSLPPEISTLQNLQVLNLMGNRIDALPRAVGDLRNLQELYLGKNRLYMFPNEMRGLRRLSYLDLSYNNFTEFELDWVQRVLPRTTIRY